MATSAPPSLLTSPASTKPKHYLPPRPLLSSKQSVNHSRAVATNATSRRELVTTMLTAGLIASQLQPVSPALAESDEEYVKETSEVISKVRNTITMDKKDPNVAEAVSELREISNYWVAKYRREKSLLGRPSFRDMYSALNAVSGHYISFGPTAPIPAKRKQRILEEMDTAEKALLRGR
ncbi:photosystem II repair protein PSB27-H1 [Carex littledalei]|uniref:Photosystem II repair protein PSB27-H1 n=1 Tax=Carex littledalei TaxID=544730 RepID=A0A833RPI6_9POAL|nr:photosystem II repair protein PSB27-H1 [Carex littledalei]